MKKLIRHLQQPAALLFKTPLQIMGVFILATSILSGCSNSGNETANTSPQGELLISLTDAPAGFASYTVDVLSLTLTTASGAVVETLPLHTRVDFAQYADLSEFLTAATVPSARYVKASMQLDYRNADIWVASSSDQQPVKVEAIVDTEGNGVSVLDVSVHLENRNSLMILPGVPAFLTLDFNLDASNEVQFDELGEPTLIVEPLLIADLHPERPKVHRVRGPLFEVDAANNRFEIIIHPFHHRLPNGDRRFGKLPVAVDDNTIYDLNGERYQGQAGLDVLASLPAFTAMIAKGNLRVLAHRFEASEVYAGSSVPGGTKDVVSGNVTQRSGNTLTVQGATLIRSDGAVVFNDSVTVEASEDTGVRKALSMQQHSIDDISVGQKVRIFGSLAAYTIGGSLVLDATGGDDRVFMDVTVLRGFALDASGPMSVELQSINFRSISLFDFTGTGSDPANDADPMSYEVDTGTLDTSTIAAGAPVAVGGFVTPFGQAPLDFAAHTVVDLAAVPGVMVVSWNPATSNPFESLDSSGMILNLTDAGIFHHVGRAGVRIDLLNPGLPPTIQPVSDATGLYILTHNATTTLFTDFESYVDALAVLLNEGGVLKSVTALGDYDDFTATLTAERIAVKVE